MWTKVLFVVFLLNIFVHNVLSYKILVVCPMPARSHHALGKGIADILHEAKHEVTLITALPEKISSYRQVDANVESVRAMSQNKENMMNFDSMAKESKISLLAKLPNMMSMLIDATFKSENVQKLINDKNEKFDLVIVEYFFNHAFVGLGVKYDCPVILVSSVSPMHWLARLTGNPVSPATIPNVFLAFNSKMNFVQRLTNTVMAIIQEVFGCLIGDYYQRISYENHFPAESHRVPYHKLNEKISMMFSNSHPSIGNPRPFLPNTVEIGGYHIGPNKALPEEYKKILDGANNGVIFFSMGSNLKSADFPVQMKSDILKALGKRKETILWKYEEDLPNTPKNVIIKSWMPQASILIHPNVKLFITHGGLLSTTEAAAAGVPVLSIPIFGDQFLNAQASQDRGCGIFIEYSNLTESSLSWGLEEVTGNPKYAATAKKTHQLFHDRPMTPRQLVAFYAEHVIRTGGAKHLSAPHLPLYSLLLLDVIAVLALPLLVLLGTTICVCKKCCGKSKSSGKKDEKRKKD